MQPRNQKTFAVLLHVEKIADLWEDCFNLCYVLLICIQTPKDQYVAVSVYRRSNSQRSCFLWVTWCSIYWDVLTMFFFLLTLCICFSCSLVLSSAPPLISELSKSLTHAYSVLSRSLSCRNLHNDCPRPTRASSPGSHLEVVVLILQCLRFLFKWRGFFSPVSQPDYFLTQVVIAIGQSSVIQFKDGMCKHCWLPSTMSFAMIGHDFLF